MSTHTLTPEQRAALDRAKDGRSLMRSWTCGKNAQARDPQKVVPYSGRLIPR